MPAVRFAPCRASVGTHLAAACAALAAACAAPAPARAVPRGLTTLRFVALNQGPGRMSCTAETAHWYSVELGTAGPGARIAHSFRVAPWSGTVFILNARGDRMPVTSLWCGISGRAWVTRAPITLERRAGVRPPPLRFVCHADTALRCDARTPQPTPDNHPRASSR